MYGISPLKKKQERNKFISKNDCDKDCINFLMKTLQAVWGLPKFYCFCTEQDFITVEILQRSLSKLQGPV